MRTLTSTVTRTGLLLALVALTGAALTFRPVPGRDTSAALDLRHSYGKAIAMGNGQARAYVIKDGRTGAPVEIGLAMSAHALEGLPKASPDHGPGTHGPYSEYLLELPADNGTPYRFAEIDWNPTGHGGPYTAPHFDFHFYRVPLATRNEIDLKNPEFETKAARLPAADEMPAGYASSHVLLKTTPAGMTVARMGLHWLDLASPELPPQNQSFTRTFIVGSWNGQVIFDEPMVTRDFILAQRTTPSAARVAIPEAKRYVPEGFYPASYGVKWDRTAGEYRIALQELSYRR